MTYQEQIRETFAHRRNADGSFDAICRHCYLTVGKARTENDLKLHEGKHRCFAMEQSGMQSDPSTGASGMRT